MKIDWLVTNTYNTSALTNQGSGKILPYPAFGAEAKDRALRPNQEASRAAGITPPKWDEEPRHLPPPKGPTAGLIFLETHTNN